MEHKIHHLPAADGKDDPFNFTLSFAVVWEEIDRGLLKGLSTIHGVDSFLPVGRYTFSVAIGRCFAPQEVLIKIKDALKQFEEAPVLTLPNKKLIVPQS